ncbi:MAG: hypothetical protein HYX92_11020 [Chloroflexi bacterium]|nr:hypothetical protein [Chloroflexota bacterium]
MTQPSEASETRTISGAVRWLEDEQRQVKAHAAKLQQLVDQLQAQNWDQAERLRLVEEALSGLQGQIARLSRLEDATRQVQETVGHIQTAWGETVEKFAENQRLWQAEIDRERVERGELQKHLDATMDTLDKAGARLQSLEEAIRKHQEPIRVLNQGLAAVVQRAESLEGRAAQSLEQHKRWQNDITRIDKELESFHEQAGIILERVRLLAEQPKRLEEQMAAVLAEEAARRSLEERVELGRSERERLERKEVELEQAVLHYREQLAEHSNLLLHLENRSQSTAGHLNELREQFWDVRQQLSERLSLLCQLEEGQKKRQVAEIEQQIRELKQWLSKPLNE